MKILQNNLYLKMICSLHTVNTIQNTIYTRLSHNPSHQDQHNHWHKSVAGHQSTDQNAVHWDHCFPLLEKEIHPYQT